MARRTKIVATIGPASDQPAQLDALLQAGVDVVRLNLSHGEVEEHVERVRQVRAAAERCARNVAILADLPGPKVRTAGFGSRGVHLATGSEVHLRPATDGGPGSTAQVVRVDYPTLLQDLSAGDNVIVGDGGITLQVTAVKPDHAVATVVAGGRATGRPGFHIPAERLRLTTPTDDDLRLLSVMASPDVRVDFVAVSFVRAAADIERVRAALGGARHPYLVAKIETAPALRNIDEIVKAADAVMVARGDLGIDLPMEEVPHAQKQVIRAAVRGGAAVITATQMLESMINAPAPTRAEVSDVANAVFDGTDAVMLSGETAIGQDPPHVVRTMARIAERAEREADYSQWAGLLAKQQRGASTSHATFITRAVALAAWQAASDIDAKAILCATRSGRTAMAMARYRPTAKLIGLSPHPETVRALALVWGVTARQVVEATSTDDIVWLAVEAAVKQGDVEHGDLVVVLAHSPDSPDASTDVLRVVRVN